jgi:large subunit ribosomal protein L25
MQLKLTATKREVRGRHVRRLRGDGKLPAVLYGHRAAAESLMLDGHEFQKVFARSGRTQLVDLVVESGRAQKVLVREIQTHPRRLGPIHVDLYRVDMKEKLHADVPIFLVGESPAVKRGDGDPLQTLHMLKVECLPSDIPEGIEVDISRLEEVDAAFRVADLKLPDGLTLLSDPEEMVAKITPRRELAAEEEVAAVAEAEGAGPEAGAEASKGDAEEGGGQDS